MSQIMSLRRPFLRDGRWYYEMDRKRLSLRTKDKSAALRLFNEIQRQYLAGKVARITGEPSTHTLGEFSDEVLAWAKATKSPETYKVWRNAVGKLTQVAGRSSRLGNLSTRQWDALHARATQQGHKATSINTYLTGLRCAFAKAVEWGYLPTNPFQRVKPLRKETRPPAFVEPGEVGVLLNAVKDVEVRQLIAALIFSGRRQGELLALRWEDVDATGYTATLFKTKQRKRFPMHPMLRSVLDAIPKTSGRIFPRWSRVTAMSHAIKVALTQAGLGHLRPHDLRHTFASLLVIEGVDLRVVQELLGHKSIRSTQIYAHLNDAALEAGLGRLKGCPADILRTGSK